MLGAPGKPKGPLQVVAVKRDSATIAWAKPDDDGGKPISGYTVEKRNKKTGKWEKVAEGVQGEKFTIPKLKEGDEYDFRVSAEGPNGVSEPLETDESTLAKNPFDAPGAPGTPECASRSLSCIEVVWKKPKNDGGNPVQGYNVERREKGQDKWVKQNKDLVKEEAFFDSKVQPKKEYEYRVAAVNEEGEGDKSQGSLLMPARPMKEKPKFDKTTAPKEIRIRAGEPLKIDLAIQGAPTPVLSWKKNDEPVVSGQNGVELTSDDDQAQLNKPKAERGDSGLYQVKMVNSEGEDSIPINVIVLDKPGPCQAPLEPTECTRSSIGLQWRPPKDDGGSELTGYVVEMCPEGSSTWEKCPGMFVKPQATINGLEEGKAYKFRVKPENIYGLGEPIETSAPIVAKLPYDPPGAPSTPEVTDSDENFIKLRWNRPVSDGGNPIQGYLIELRPTGGQWQACNSFPHKSTEFSATNVRKGVEYEFRVKAVNDAGPGEASMNSLPRKAELPVTPASRMMQPVVDEIARDHVKLSWQKPTSDGNAPIEAYVIEKKTGDDGEWIEVKEVGPKETSASVTNVAEGEECQFRVRARNAAGLNEPSAPTQLVKVENQPEKPSFGVSRVKDITVKAGQHFEIHVPYKAWPVPKATWTRGEKELAPEAGRVEMNTPETVAQLLNHKAQRGDTGEYCVLLENSEGSGRMTLNVTVLDVPAAPTGPLQVNDLDAEGCTLSWKPPADNGGNEVTNYVVEKREAGTGKWHKVSPNCLGTSCPVRGLEEGKDYEFRVMAENKEGLSEPLLVEDSVRAKWPFDPPGVPGTPECTGHTENSISLKWERPVSDGGSPITGYVVEKKEEGSDKWVPVAEKLNDTELTVRGLQEGKKYEFRVAASNKAATGKPAKTEKAIEARQPDSAPKVAGFGFGSGPKEITVRAGETLVLPVAFTGSPVPEVVWTRNGSPVAADERIKATVKPEEVSLTTQPAQIGDTGLYTCTLKNDLGSDKCAFNVIVLDKPGKPEGPLEASEIKQDGCRLTWKAPKENGNSPITNYVVEKMDPKKGVWEKVTSFCRVPTYEVMGLDEGRAYQFRVMAENNEGKSLPLETLTTVTPKNPCVKPAAPTGLRANNQTAETVGLEWNPVAGEGVNKIAGYQVEMCEPGSDEWSPVEGLVRGTSLDVGGLKPNKAYKFRVKAKNAAGYGPACTEDLSVSLKPDYVRPDAPGIPSFKKVGRNFVELTWEAPVRDGGAKITGYVVEKRQPGAEVWSKACAYNPHETECRVDDLVENGVYEFRVKAVNKAGESEPSSSTGGQKISEYPNGVKPEFTREAGDAEGAAGKDVTFSVGFEGSPAPEAVWFKAGFELTNGKRYTITQDGSSSTLTIHNLYESDGSKVSCVVSNPLGKVSCEASLKIKSAPRLESAGPGDQEVAQGETLKLKVPISGKGPFEFKLKKDGVTLPEGAKFKVNENDGTVSLTMPNVSQEDEGRYVGWWFGVEVFLYLYSFQRSRESICKGF